MPELPDRSEEILEKLWGVTQEDGRSASTDLLVEDDAVDALRHAGLIETRDGAVTLTADGRREAEHCVRRHRLAERLLVDVLASGEEDIHRAGCKFEHGLHRGLEERVCTMLGHPRACPHGKPIPPGECCRRMQTEVEPLLVSVADLQKGQRAVIAYLQSEHTEDLRKLMAIGALPGTRVVLRQRFPSYLVDLGESQFAIDEEMARQVYVRREQP